MCYLRQTARGAKECWHAITDLRVGETGIVGYVTGSGKARVALDTGQDAVFFNNPDLPETRSEIALPLLDGEEVIGAS